MGKKQDFDTHRRIVLAGAIVGAATVMFNLNQGLTGAATGAAGGCGGSLEQVTESSLPAAATPRVVQARAKTQLKPILNPGTMRINFTPMAQPTLPRAQPVPGKPASPNTTIPAGQLSDAIALLQDAGANSFVMALKTTGLDGILRQAGTKFTIFAPTDAAMDQLADSMPHLFKPQNEALLQEVLSYHIVPQMLRSGDLGGGAVETLATGQSISVNAPLSFTDWHGNTSALVYSDRIGNGVAVHGIDRVLVPAFSVPVVLRNAGFSHFILALQLTQLDAALYDTNADFTVFAPENMAFEAAGFSAADLGKPEYAQEVAKMLKRHIVKGIYSSHDLLDDAAPTMDQALLKGFLDGPDLVIEHTKGGSSIVTQSDVKSDNGYVHRLDQMLVP